MFVYSRRLTKYAPHVAAATITAASVQGYILIQAYRNNPRGTLVIPAGKTSGEEVHDDTLNLLGAVKEKLREHKQHLQERLPAVAQASRNTLQRWESLRLNAESSDQRSNIPSKWWRQNFFKKAQDNTASDGSIELDIPVPLIKSHRIIVIGDSLACGVGCVNRWAVQNEKNSVIEAEQYSAMDKSCSQEVESGPVLPRMFANTLSHRLQCRVQWKSAGVVGGDVDDIRNQCMDLIRQEALKGNPPDVVVIICGMNDMKKMLCDPMQASSAFTFRRKLISLIEEIHVVAPNAKVVLPALPLVGRELEPNNLLNMFPLNLFVDHFVSLWDLQKHYVAEEMPSSVTFIGRPSNGDFSDSSKSESETVSLTSVDGVHPSTHGYAVWAKYLGNKLMDKMECVKEKSKEKLSMVRDVCVKRND